MTSLLASNKEPLVGMGQVVLVKKPETAKSVLGSCVGLTLFHPRVGVGVLAHVVLPASEGRDGLPGKFADTAVPFMVKVMMENNANKSGIVAKLTGGANMFGGDGPIQIGKSNAEAIRKALAGFNIPIVAENIGGTKGRRIAFDTTNGEVIVEVVGEPPIRL